MRKNRRNRRRRRTRRRRRMKKFKWVGHGGTFLKSWNKGIEAGSSLDL